MTDRFDDDLDLPPELAALDAELSSITYEERPSFGPELRAELRRVRRATPVGASPRPLRPLLAAGLAGLLVLGLGVPSARGALVGLLTSIPGWEGATPATISAPATTPPRAEGLLGEMGPDREDPDDGGLVALPASATFSPPQAARGSRSAYAGFESVTPRLRDRSSLPGLLAAHYPPELESAGVGGTVGLLIWVDSLGAVDGVSIARGSGQRGLDRAALDMAGTFRFDPGQRLGARVGTWVELDLVFDPGPAPDSLASAARPPDGG